MADSEFEEFRQTFGQRPQHLGATAPFYALVHDIGLDEVSPTSSRSDADISDCDIALGATGCPVPNGSSSSGLEAASAATLSSGLPILATTRQSTPVMTSGALILGPASIGNGLRRNSEGGEDDCIASAGDAGPPAAVPAWPMGERRRRRLPEIPKNRKPLISSIFNTTQTSTESSASNCTLSLGGPSSTSATSSANFCSLLSRDMSLADELTSANAACNPNLPGAPPTALLGATSHLAIKCGYLWDDTDDSPDSDRLLTDADSGHSTAHSPTTDGAKSMSPVLGMSASVLVAGSGASGAVGEAGGVIGMMVSPAVRRAGGGVPYPDVELLEGTHRGLHKFLPRHQDEIEVEIGDPIYVQKEADDLWCEGVNLRTGRLGIFPGAYVVDCDLTDWDSNTEHGRRERYLLGYLGSVETWAHKGTAVVCQAVRRVVGNHGDGGKSQATEIEAHPCILEISDQGLRMVDRRKRKVNDPCIDYFYSLKNVSFCAFHPRDHRYLGFITKHPTLQRFACHVFRGNDSTRPVAESVGRAFQRFYQKFIETAYPIEDIYIE